MLAATKIGAIAMPLFSGFGADAIVHLGKHGSLEWLPGKNAALSASCGTDAALGDLPLIYPFLVNDPGEGTQAKRRAHAVLVGRATLYGVAAAGEAGGTRALDILRGVAMFNASASSTRRLRVRERASSERTDGFRAGSQTGAPKRRAVLFPRALCLCPSLEL